MDGMVLGIFLIAAFAGGFVNGLSGFAMSLVVSGIWLHILTPIQTVTLLVGYGLLVQGYGIWKLRHALNWRLVAPFISGGAIGVPIGVALLGNINPSSTRTIVGVLLTIYSVYGLARPAFKPVQAHPSTDIGIGVLNGLLGGLTGFAGIIVVVWCQLRNWPKDIQRAISQPVTFAAFAMSAISLSLKGDISAETISLYAFGLPLVAAGMWTGFNLYGRLDDAAFRKVVLLLLLVAAVGLIVPSFFQLRYASVHSSALAPASERTRASSAASSLADPE
jgi:uncharacterized protein